MMQRQIEESLLGNTLRIQEIEGVHFLTMESVPNTSKPLHSHKFAFFNFLIRGTASEDVPGYGQIVYRPYEIYFHPSDEKHSAQIGSEGSMSCAVILGPERVASLQSSGLPLDRTMSLEGPEFHSIAVRMANEFNRGDKASILSLQGLFLQLIAELSRKQGLPGANLVPWLIQAREYIDSNLTQKISLDDVASVIGIHPVHLAHKFRKHFGITLGAYIRRSRVSRAKDKLSTTTDSIADIGMALGFYDHAHFVKVFRAESGMTPSHYRKQFSG